MSNSSRRSNRGARHSSAGRQQELKLQLLEMGVELGEKKLALERERARMCLELINGDSKNKVRAREESPIPKIPKGFVPKYVEGDDITKWFTAFERACKMRHVKLWYWGSLLCELFSGKGRVDS